MPRIARFRIVPGILVAAVVGLFGCPQLLDDNFSAKQICLDQSCALPYASGGSGSDAGSADAGGTENGGAAGTSAGSGSSGASGDAGSGSGSGSGGASGSAGTSGNAGASGSHAGSAGASGSAGAGGSGGTGGTADAGGSAGQSGTSGAAGTSSGGSCSTLVINSTTQSASSNCVGIYGWDNIQVDTANSNVTLSFSNGGPCFNGTIASTGWGATYEMTFANATDPDHPQVPGEVWNATSAGVTGFEFAYSGSTQPSSLHIIYKDTSGTDYCKIIGPGDTTVPFSSAHPNNCSSTGSTVDMTELGVLIFAFPINNQPYNVDFCVQISATQ
ncbi:MAG TPA: hypothetical protein VG963_08705 [Polyangiaceae bacterium]|nr:hypothetical protein [Polyangiaceae bacterium]